MYTNALKKKMCEEICIDGASTIKTSQKYNVPLKTLEKWITAYHKDSSCFDNKQDPSDFHFLDNNPTAYEDMNKEELKHLLLKKDIEIARLKKGYLVKGDGMENKVFVTLSKKNTK